MQQDERRTTPRYPFSAFAEIFDHQEDSRIRSRVRDLSLGGCYVETADPLPLGKNVMIEIYTNEEFLEAHATVAFRQADHGMGLTFGVLQPYFATVLAGWLARAQSLYVH